MTPLAMLGFGFVLGMRHATDVDHVAAMTATAGRERTFRAALGLGTLWGLGHTLTVLVVGGAIVAFGLAIPERLSQCLELGVAAMLVMLGLANFSQSRHASDEIPKVPFARPLIVGIVHGLAGSAAVALLVLTTIRNTVLALSYLAVFGLGTMLGMALVTAGIVVPLGALAGRFRGADRILVRALGVVSIGVGLWLAYQVGIASGLFLGEPLATK